MVIGRDCCWDMFTGPGFTGKRLRLCPGRYFQEDLEDFAPRVRSLRPVDHFNRFPIRGK